MPNKNIVENLNNRLCEAQGSISKLEDKSFEAFFDQEEKERKNLGKSKCVQYKQDAIKQLTFLTIQFSEIQMLHLKKSH